MIYETTHIRCARCGYNHSLSNNPINSKISPSCELGVDMVQLGSNNVPHILFSCNVCTANYALTAFGSTKMVGGPNVFRN